MQWRTWLGPAIRIGVGLLIAAWQAYQRGRQAAITEQDKADAEAIAKAERAGAEFKHDDDSVRIDPRNRDAD